MGIFDIFRRSDPEAAAAQRVRAENTGDLQRFVQGGQLPALISARLSDARAGRRPWTASLTPAELMIARSHGLRPVATVSSTCWLHYGWSWTNGHSEGWNAALQRLRQEALAAGANAVLDVKMRTLALGVSDSMDFTLIGTAAFVEGLPPSSDPVIATVPALEFVKLLDADVVPTGIAVGAHYEWMNDWRGATNLAWMGNIESEALSALWERVRHSAHQQLRMNARPQGNGVLAHINFSQMFEREGDRDTKQYLARHIVVATTVDARRGKPFPHPVNTVVDMHRGRTPLSGIRPHHQSYASNQSDGAI